MYDFWTKYRYRVLLFAKSYGYTKFFIKLRTWYQVPSKSIFRNRRAGSCLEVSSSEKSPRAGSTLSVTSPMSVRHTSPSWHGTYLLECRYRTTTELFVAIIHQTAPPSTKPPHITRRVRPFAEGSEYHPDATAQHDDDDVVVATKKCGCFKTTTTTKRRYVESFPCFQ
jgi:hypothetical protein